MKILIYRVGSFGDGLIAIPSLKYIRNRFPLGKIVLLTNRPSPRSEKEITVDDIFLSERLIDDVIFYKNKWHLFFYILPILAFSRYRYLFYLMPVRNFIQLFRDYLVFKLLFINEIIGINFGKNRFHQFNSMDNLWENESIRLLRCIGGQNGYSRFEPLTFSSEVNNDINRSITKPLPHPYIVINLGGKFPVKNWGLDNWNIFLSLVGKNFPEFNFVAIGSHDEKEVCNLLTEACNNKLINLCGLTTPVQAMHVLKGARIFIGHDSGPMHLAAAVGVELIAIFSSIAKPGIWFPLGEKSKVLYNDIECKGCGLTSCIANKARCIKGISPNMVFDQFVKTIEKN